MGARYSYPGLNDFDCSWYLVLFCFFIFKINKNHEMEKANVYNDSGFNFTSPQNFGLSRAIEF